MNKDFKDFMLGFLCGVVAVLMFVFIHIGKDFKPDPCGAPGFKSDWPLNYPECARETKKEK